MGASVGAGKPRAEINVVPLIDIVLVLLIIFMVMTPMLQRGYDMTIPQKADVDVPAGVSEQMIVFVKADGKILLNKEETNQDALRAKLEDLLRGRRDKIVFFQADDEVIYQEAITAMDSIRAAGGTVGLVTTDLKQ